MLDRQLMQSALDEITQIRASLFAARETTDTSHPRYQSLLNLKQYLILRSKDRTVLQEKLFMMSLSSLGRSYAHVAASIDTLYDQLNSSLHAEEIEPEMMESFHHLSIGEAIATASKNSTMLFGGRSSSKLSMQSTAVMVTLPSHAAGDKGRLIRELADAGVNVFRINTAHDSPETWLAMADVITAINSGRKEADKIMIFVDLAGPKIRTGPIRRLDLPVAIGSNKREKEVLIYAGEKSTRGERVDPQTLRTLPAQISVDKKFFTKIKKEHFVKIVDVNSKKAFIAITEVGEGFARGLINKKVFIDEHSKMHRKRYLGKILNIEKQIDPIRLFVNDTLVITEEERLGRSAQLDENNRVVKPARISCSFRGAASAMHGGEKIFIDDGKIGLEVLESSDNAITCRVTHAKANGTLLKEEKGINFPDTPIKTSALTQNDRENLLAVLGFADHLSLSFCQDADDVRELQKMLEENGRSDIGIVAKIETKKAVINMPQILEQLLTWEKSGVMIARGDLAIEVGFRNLAYVQEALLDICDAAHIPVIWATQVLENQMKSNLPSRAEVSDAAMAGRAECVMLNKGAFATDTIDVLTHILDDMHTIFKKNRQLLKRETIWQL